MNRDEILAADDLPTDTFTVPVWGEVTIRTLDGEQREELENLIQNFKARGASKKSVRALAAVYSLVNKGTIDPMFKVEDATLLAKKSGVVLDTIFDRVLKLNAMTKAEAEAISGN